MHITRVSCAGSAAMCGRGVGQVCTAGSGSGRGDPVDVSTAVFNYFRPRRRRPAQASARRRRENVWAFRPILHDLHCIFLPSLRPLGAHVQPPRRLKACLVISSREARRVARCWLSADAASDAAACSSQISFAFAPRRDLRPACSCSCELQLAEALGGGTWYRAPCRMQRVDSGLRAGDRNRAGNARASQHASGQLAQGMRGEQATRRFREPPQRHSCRCPPRRWGRCTSRRLSWYTSRIDS
jgi:hypothetical protein